MCLGLTVACIDVQGCFLVLKFPASKLETTGPQCCPGMLTAPRYILEQYSCFLKITCTSHWTRSVHTATTLLAYGYPRAEELQVLQGRNSLLRTFYSDQPSQARATQKWRSTKLSHNTTYTKVGFFPGLRNEVSWFVPNFSRVAAVLNKLLRKGQPRQFSHWMKSNNPQFVVEWGPYKPTSVAATRKQPLVHPWYWYWWWANLVCTSAGTGRRK